MYKIGILFILLKIIVIHSTIAQNGYKFEQLSDQEQKNKTQHAVTGNEIQLINSKSYTVKIQASTDKEEWLDISVGGAKAFVFTLNRQSYGYLYLRLCNQRVDDVLCTNYKLVPGRRFVIRNDSENPEKLVIAKASQD